MSDPSTPSAMTTAMTTATTWGPLPVQAAVRHSGNGVPMPELLRPVSRERDHDWVKPTGGFWTSTWSPDYGSGWMDWCIDNMGGTTFDDVWLLTPDPSARIYTVDSHADLVALVREFPGVAHRIFAPAKYPAWASVALDYDAVHLTERGEAETRLSVDVDLYGWDCESTLWFRWCFLTVEHHGIWSPPTEPCPRPEGEPCWRCDNTGERIHYLSRWARQKETIDA